MEQICRDGDFKILKDAAMERWIIQALCKKRHEWREGF